MDIRHGKTPNTFYRVSVRALILSDDGDKVLMVKEDGDWALPGGGMDHGESLEQALHRELSEEVGTADDAPFEFQIVGAESAFKARKDAWMLNVICKVNFAGDKLPSFSKGADAEEIRFLTKDELAKLPLGDNIGIGLALKYAFGEEK